MRRHCGACRRGRRHASSCRLEDLALADNLTRRGALATFVGLAAAALAACNAPQSAQPPTGAAAPKTKIAAITVKSSDLAASSGDEIAAWVQTALPAELARSFAPDMAPGDPDAATLHVQISSVTLATVGGAAGAIDGIRGEATLSGGGTPISVELVATTTYFASPGDRTLQEAARRQRVNALLRAFADWLPRKFDL